MLEISLLKHNDHNKTKKELYYENLRILMSL